MGTRVRNGAVLLLVLVAACARHGGTGGGAWQIGGVAAETIKVLPGQREVPVLPLRLSSTDASLELRGITLEWEAREGAAPLVAALELYRGTTLRESFDPVRNQKIADFELDAQRRAAKAELRVSLRSTGELRLFVVARMALTAMGESLRFSVSSSGVSVRGSSGKDLLNTRTQRVFGPILNVEKRSFAAHFVLSGGGSRAALRLTGDPSLSRVLVSGNPATALRREATGVWSMLLPPVRPGKVEVLALDESQRVVARLSDVASADTGKGVGRFRDVSLQRLPLDNHFSQDAEVADMDGDGDPDLLIPSYAGQQDRLYMGDGRGRFVDVTETHMPVLLFDSVHMEPCDVDQDGDVDVVIAVEGAQNRLLLNDGAGHLRDVTMDPGRMPEDSDYSEDLQAGDLDGDGDFDLVVANLVDAKDQRKGGQIRVYQNDGKGYFHDMTGTWIPLGATRSYDVEIADFDGDGDLDLFSANYGEGASLYRNDGLGVLTDVSTGLAGRAKDRAFHTAACTGDVDGDGDLDILLGTFQGQSLVYSNLGGMRFGLSRSALPTLDMSTYDLALGDVDGDGDLDVLFANTSNPSILMRNDGKGKFLPVSRDAFDTPDDRAYDVQFLDANLDGVLDVLITCWGERQDTLYIGSSTLLADDETRVLRVEPNHGAPRGSEWVTLRGRGFVKGMEVKIGGRPLAEFRVLNERTAQGRTPALPVGTVDLEYRRPLQGAQRIANAFVYVEPPKGAFIDVSSEVLGGEPRSTASVTSGDLDGDGLGDIVFADASVGARVRLSNAKGVMRHGSFPKIMASANEVELADLDGDGKLDLILVDANGPPFLFKGLGDGSFANPLRLTIPKSGAEEVAVGDVNGDGHLDLVFATTGTEPVLLGDGKLGFSELAQAKLRSDDTRGLALADMDADGDLDLLTANFRAAPRLYRNDGKGNFTELLAALPNNKGDQSYAIAAADFDRDGDLDVAIANGGAQVNRLFLNAGKGICTEAPVGVFRPALGGGAHVLFADFDGDKDPDLFSSHFWGNNHLYYSEAGKLAERPGILPSSPGGFAGACAQDLDGDGDLDLILAAFWGGCRVLRNPLRR